MANVYAFRQGRSIRGLNPQEVGEELERIRHEKGVLNPENTLEAAKPEDSPLHNAFDWDDSTAAHEHRLTQARRLTTSIRILNSPAGKPTVAYVSVKRPDSGRSYVPTIEALSDAELRVRLLVEARNFIESLERKYTHLAEVGDLLDRLKKAVG